MEAQNNPVRGKTVLITGGTGSFGQQYTQYLLDHCDPAKVIVFSRDEYKQFQMQRRYADYSNIRFFIGDVRDLERLRLALYGVDVVVHAAALKHIPVLEYNPTEAVQTNVDGTRNVMKAALEEEVEKVLLISTDKAANPVNLYGATKMSAEKLLIASNAYAGKRKTRFSAVRYGNVLNSRGNIVETILNDETDAPLSLTHEEMTRFWITLEDSFALVQYALTNMVGGEVFVPKASSMKTCDLLNALAPHRETTVTGIRPGEKIHETLISCDEARRTLEQGDYFVILPTVQYQKGDPFQKHREHGTPLTEDFEYSSNTNSQWLTVETLRVRLGLT